jgi:hypothetical protein
MKTAFEELTQNPKRASSLAPRGTSPEYLLSFGAALRGLCAPNITRILALALAGMCTVASFGCRPAQPPKLEFRIGDAAAAGSLTYNVVEARWVSQLDAFPTPRIPERNFLLVRILITNGSGTEVGIPFMKLINSNGDTFTESENGAGVDHWLGLIRRINPAQSDDGWLLFDVPTNSYKLGVSDGAVENEHVALISIPLSMNTDVPAAPKP